MLVDHVYRCDRCNADVDNADLVHCIIVNSADLSTGSVQTFHFCLANNCASQVLSDENLAAYRAR